MPSRAALDDWAVHGPEQLKFNDPRPKANPATVAPQVPVTPAGPVTGPAAAPPSTSKKRSA